MFRRVVSSDKILSLNVKYCFDNRKCRRVGYCQHLKVSTLGQLVSLEMNVSDCRIYVSEIVLEVNSNCATCSSTINSLKCWFFHRNKSNWNAPDFKGSIHSLPWPPASRYAGPREISTQWASAVLAFRSYLWACQMRKFWALQNHQRIPSQYVLAVLKSLLIVTVCSSDVAIVFRAWSDNRAK